jgi:hypothetical protein
VSISHPFYFEKNGKSQWETDKVKLFVFKLKLKELEIDKLDKIVWSEKMRNPEHTFFNLDRIQSKADERHVYHIWHLHQKMCEVLFSPRLLLIMSFFSGKKKIRISTEASTQSISIGSALF